MMNLADIKPEISYDRAKLVDDSITLLKAEINRGWSQVRLGSRLIRLGIGLGLFLIILGLIFIGILLTHPQYQQGSELWVLLGIYEVLSIISGSVIYAVGTLVSMQGWGLIAIPENTVVDTSLLTDEQKLRIIGRPIP